jgi:hypothetical protein
LTLNLLCQFALPSKVSVFFIHISINLFHFLYFSSFIAIINIFGTKNSVAQIMEPPKQEEISHQPMDQLHGIEYCIDSNPSWG